MPATREVRDRGIMRLPHPYRAAAMASLLTLVSLTGFPTVAAAGEDEAGPARILILPIVVHSVSADASHVSGGLSDMIASRLEQSRRVVVDRPDDAELATSRIGDALRQGRARGSDFVIFGAFTQFGDGASLDLQCIPVNVASESEAAAARRIFIQSGTVGEIIPRLDEISGRLAAYVNAGRPEPVPSVAGAEGVPAQAPPAPDSAAALRDLADRLEALEEAVFGADDASTAAQLGDVPPES
jgi:hypothetical protein